VFWGSVMNSVRLRNLSASSSAEGGFFFPKIRAGTIIEYLKILDQ